MILKLADPVEYADIKPTECPVEQDGTFLLPEEIPANILRLKRGDKVRVLRYRPVLRVGYRLTAANFRTQASQVVDTDEFKDAWNKLSRVAGCHLERHDMVSAVSYGLCAKAKCGGEWRGIMVSSDPIDFVGDTVLTVESTRCVKTGYRHPPQSWYDSFTGEHDYDPGGLSKGKTVILVTVAGYNIELMSGDLTRA